VVVGSSFAASLDDTFREPNLGSILAPWCLKAPEKEEEEFVGMFG
jgi:hypothetical protein